MWAHSTAGRTRGQRKTLVVKGSISAACCLVCGWQLEPQHAFDVIDPQCSSSFILSHWCASLVRLTRCTTGRWNLEGDKARNDFGAILISHISRGRSPDEDIDSCALQARKAGHVHWLIGCWKWTLRGPNVDVIHSSLWQPKRQLHLAAKASPQRFTASDVVVNYSLRHSNHGRQIGLSKAPLLHEGAKIVNTYPNQSLVVFIFRHWIMIPNGNKSATAYPAQAVAFP